MTTALWVLGIVAVVIAIARWLMIPSLVTPIAEARRRGEVGPVVEVVAALKPRDQATAYNHAIRQLWGSYDRPLAIELIKVLAENHSSALIAQYWLQQALQVEPEMARHQISRDFLDTYFQPEVAASCGPVG